MVKGYEFNTDRYVMFEPAELKAPEEGYLTPDKRGAKPYGLLLEAMRKSGRCALATWACPR